MKLKSINAIVSDDSGNETFQTIDIPFCGSKVGSGTALIPIKLATDVVPTVKVDLSSATQVSKKGLVSAMVKVSVPYLSYTTDASGTAVADPKRVGYNSYHAVVTLNRYCVEDASGKNGPLAQDYAIKQILAGLGLRLMTGGALFGAPTKNITLDESGAHVAQPTFQVSFATDASTTDVRAFTMPKFETDGSLDVGSATGMTGPTSMLSRVLNGMPPIGCDDIAEAASWDTGSM